jgi:N-acetylneuraminate synthase
MSIFIIAEIGINHNGDMAICKELIDVAVNSGCDAVKFQKRDINLVYTREFLDSPRESVWGSTQRDQKLGLEFDELQYQEIASYCNSKQIEWFASAWDLNSLIFLDKFNLRYHKIASAMLVDINFLNAVADRKKHTFISTGMSTIEDIDRAVDIFKLKKCSFELMHCVSTYPMSDKDANLKVINFLKDRYKCDVGYSGHEVGLAVSIGASALGISSLERHITLDRAMYGSDQAASVEPSGLKYLIGAVRKVEAALGDGVKRTTSGEAEVAKKLRAHIPFQSNSF